MGIETNKRIKVPKNWKDSVARRIEFFRIHRYSIDLKKKMGD